MRVGQRHRLDLIVRHVDQCRAQPPPQLRDLEPHLDPQLGIEIAERLVEQKHLRVAHDGAADGHALPLPARERRGLALADSRSSRSSSPTSSTFGLDLALAACATDSAKPMFSRTVICG